MPSFIILVLQHDPKTSVRADGINRWWPDFSTNLRLHSHGLLESFPIEIFFLSTTILNPVTPKGDQDRISPYNINTKSSTEVMRLKKIIS